MALTMAMAEIHSRVFKALAHPVRLLLVDALRGGDLTFGALEAKFKLDKSTVSQHLRVLVNAGLVSTRRAGRETIYRLETCCIDEFSRCVTKVVRQRVKKQACCLGRR
ncbi:MAG TPA: metalloregulator ArsR/SmtB family transcription factor [bacterium]|mgnify:CR=1 FL=1|nr:metalloregulator ArsR/SmtB family transcription factor [bacterium]